jgi:hypothetical protein
MKKPDDGTGPPAAFVVEFGRSWERWAKLRTEADLDEIGVCLKALQDGFGKPHLHSGLGLRRLTPRIFEFRVSRGLQVVFAFIKPRTFQLAMTGTHDHVRTWLKENA